MNRDIAVAGLLRSNGQEDRHHNAKRQFPTKRKSRRKSRPLLAWFLLAPILYSIYYHYTVFLALKTHNGGLYADLGSGMPEMSTKNLLFSEFISTHQETFFGAGGGPGSNFFRITGIASGVIARATTIAARKRLQPRQSLFVRRNSPISQGIDTEPASWKHRLSVERLYPNLRQNRASI